MLLTLAGYMFREAPRDYSAQSLWNSIFLRLLPQSASPKEDLGVLGLDDRFVRYTGVNTYAMPTEQEAIRWRSEMMKQTDVRKVIRYYAVRPGLAFKRFATAVQESMETRPPYLGNFEQSAGRPPGARTNAFALWSNLKRWLGERHTWLSIFILLGASLCTAFAARISGGFHFSWLFLASAVVEAAISCFADGLDWGRHLFLAQTMVDIFFLFAAASAAVFCSSLVRRNAG